MDKIQELYGHYEKSGHVFKKCGSHIVVLKKTDNTKTNETRKVADTKYAKYRGSRFFVTRIFEICDPSHTCNGVMNTFYSYVTIEYTTGTFIEVGNFDEEVDAICAPGIHYFKSLEAAYYYSASIPRNGVHKVFEDDGNITGMYNYTDGKLHGECREYVNGSLVRMNTYVNGRKEGLGVRYHSNGFVHSKWMVDVNGKVIDECVYSENDNVRNVETKYPDGIVHSNVIYKNKLLDGTAMYYYENGKVSAKMNYKDGKQHGCCEVYWPNGQLRNTCQYFNDLKDGEFCEYNELGRLCKTTSYARGIENGYSFEYNDNGTIKKTHFYKRGNLLKSYSR
jgi:antitoxin component YwqK of YwqJK toxin-antitoxin module